VEPDPAQLVEGPDAAPRDMSPGYTTGAYWRRRNDMIYYDYVDYMVRTIAKDARSMIDVGSGNCPYLEWFDWIPDRVSVDINVPYSSETVKGLRGDIFEMDFGQTFDVCTCLQVLEHVPDATRFARKLLQLAPVVLVSVPYRWPRTPLTKGHIHDPVTYFKLTRWMGRRANFHTIVQEPFGGRKSRRLIAIYFADSARRIVAADVKQRIIR
jgi:SAM-dependent methyltransferase